MQDFGTKLVAQQQCRGTNNQSVHCHLFMGLIMLWTNSKTTNDSSNTKSHKWYSKKPGFIQADLARKIEATKDSERKTKEEDYWDKQTRISSRAVSVSALALGFLIAATIIAGFALNETKRQADAAVAALVRIERPIILTSAPEEFTMSAGLPLVRPEVCVVIENVGKQVATIGLAFGDLSVQKSTDAPVGQITQSQYGSYCNARILGEWVIKPMDTKGISCRRSARLSSVDIDNVVRNAGYAFFRFNTLYSDPLGYQRQFASTYLWRPDRPGQNVGRFVQINSEESRPHEQTQGAKANNQSVIVRAMLDIERDQGADLTPRPCASLSK
jgi:hypothetical protein